MTSHEKFIKRTYVLAQAAQTNGDHPFGAVLVVAGEVALECLNTVNTSADATRHPELDILRLATTELSAADLERATIYASTEPYAMCCGTVNQASNISASPTAAGSACTNRIFRLAVAAP